MNKIRLQTISGREASILALLAQCQNISSRDVEMILSTLDAGGTAFKIGQIMTGQIKCRVKKLQVAADGFITWAQKLKSLR